MAQKLQQQLRDVGSKLGSLPASKDAVIKLLKQAANCLSEIEQSPLPSMLDSMKPLVKAIARQELLKHLDRDVKVLVATCICEVTRITAPEAPFSDDVLKDIFHLIVGTFSGLSDINSPSFGRRVVILETLARYRSCIVMLDLDCDELINEMFSIFFAVISDDHPKNVVTSMQKIIVLILDESEDIQENLLSTILSPLGRKQTVFSSAARRLAMDVIEQCVGKLEPPIKQFLVSSLSGDGTFLGNSIDYHEVIYDVYQCAPQILYGIVPYITGELLADSLDVRLKAVQLLGELFALSEFSISESFQPLFTEFLKRLTDRVVEVRVSVIEHLKNCLISNPTRPEAPSIIKALCDRLLDYNENVRKQVVAALCDVACHSVNVIPAETVRLVAERLRDKSLSVKRYTIERLAELYRFYCIKSMDGSASVDELEWIPGKIVRCLYDKDFRSEAIELLLCGFLFPPEFSLNDRLKHWATVFSGFDKAEVKALEQILLQKQRLQQEMQKYLSLRQTYQEDAPELQKRISGCFRTMSRLFSEPTKAEEGFQILNQLKDVNIWKMLTALLDPCTPFHQAWSFRDDLLKILGEKHPLYDFMCMLSTKCSYLLFNKEYVKEILVAASSQKPAGNVQFISSCMGLLAIIACFSPQLLAGLEENLVNLLKENNEIIKEGVAHVLAKAGGTIREQLATTSSSVDLLLERLCLEGSRKQAKYSVQALAAITKDDGLKSLSVLYKRLVDILEEKTHLPAILQSLGCIAQIAMPVFETREDEIFGFIKHKILECNNKVQEISKNKAEWNDRTELCLLKIYGMKTLVKSYLPIKDAHLRPGIEKIMEILKNILRFGDISNDAGSSAVDKAHMRLASAKAVLRLSRQWDHMIPLDVFYLTLRVSEDAYAKCRELFISKVQQYIKERFLDAKYACAFLLNVNKFRSPEYREGKNNLLEIIQICRQAKVRQLPMQSDGNSTIAYPEYILVYLIHALAHHPSCPSIDECKDVEAFEPIYWRLHLFLSALLQGEGGQSGVGPSKMESYAKVVSIFHSIKCSEDVVDLTKSKISHALCDLGLSIAKRLVNDQPDTSIMDASLRLLPTLYKTVENTAGEKSVDSDECSWLGGESVWAHFEALTFEDKEPSETGAAKEEMILEEKDADGNEVPLGKMIKILKSQGAKKKKNLKQHTSPSDAKETENEIDVLGVIREINLDSAITGQGMEMAEFTKDNGLTESRPVSTGNNIEDVLVSRKRNETNGIAILSVPTPKRKRSASMQRSQSKSIKSRSESAQSNKKKNLSFVQKLAELDAELMDPDLLVCQSPKIKSTPNKGVDESKIGGADPEKSTNVGDTNEKMGNISSKGSLKKRKVRSISGLAKCSSDGTVLNNEELVGSRIRVWWPLDKAFYEGVVQSYDPDKKKHEILYDDGDVEVLNLSKEKWEPITSMNMRKKQNKSQHPPPQNEIMPEKVNKKNVPSNSRRKKNSPKKIERKHAPKKTHTELISQKASENESEGSDAKGKGDSDLAGSHSHSTAEINDINSDGHEDKNNALSPLEAEEIKAESPKMPVESSQQEVPDATSLQCQDDSDDEPLNAWKMRVAKVI